MDLPAHMRQRARTLGDCEIADMFKLAADIIEQGDENQRLLFDLIGPGACANSLWEEQPGLRQAYACAKARKNAKVRP